MEILETIANINYNAARPRPVDAASLFDLVKIRRLVDEATNLAVRAASDIASPILTNVHGGFGDAASMGLGGSGHGAKLSRERKFRMREQASQKLARAYRLDEIVCSVATMQGASPLENVAQSVLQRNPKDLDAKYVHLFHEKIPSRQLAESTSVQPLTDIIVERPTEPEVLRTRATVKVFKEDLEGAAQDLTHALSLCRFHRPSHAASQEEVQLQEPQRARRRPQDVILAEKDRPSSLEGQLVFQRGSVYLTMACQLLGQSLPPQQRHESPTGDGTVPRNADDEDVNGAKQEAARKQLESRKSVKILAKRALRDYMAFISQFEYSPYLPIGHVKEFNDRINMVAVQGIRNPRPSDAMAAAEPHKAYLLADLFAPLPPPDLPPYPSQSVVRNGSQPFEPETSCEWTTYHPLLSDALHSLLLCHCLVQTSPKELQRHAYMVARLVRLSDGYPVFQASRSPSRSDWVEVLRRADNWLNLSASWETLCAPAPIPIYDAPADQKSTPNPGLAASAAKALINGESPESVAEDMRKERIREQAIMEALDDERVVDEETFRASILAREKRAEEDYYSHGAAVAGKSPAANGSHPHAGSPSRKAPQRPPAESPMKRWGGAGDGDSREYPILTERASAIAIWVRDAPVVTGTAKRKKRTKKRSSSSSASKTTAAAAAAAPAPAAGIEAGMSKLDVEEEEPAET